MTDKKQDWTPRDEVWTIDGITVEASPCDHPGCTSRAAETDAARVVAGMIADARRCVFCKEPIRPFRITLIHMTQWTLGSYQSESSVSIQLYSNQRGSVGVDAHERCADKVFPGLVVNPPRPPAQSTGGA